LYEHQDGANTTRTGGQASIQVLTGPDVGEPRW